jgi:hypothetical protein
MSRCRRSSEPALVDTQSDDMDHWTHQKPIIRYMQFRRKAEALPDYRIPENSDVEEWAPICEVDWHHIPGVPRISKARYAWMASDTACISLSLDDGLWSPDTQEAAVAIARQSETLMHAYVLEDRLAIPDCFWLAWRACAADYLNVSMATAAGERTHRRFTMSLSHSNQSAQTPVKAL